MFSKSNLFRVTLAAGLMIVQASAYAYEVTGSTTRGRALKFTTTDAVLTGRTLTGLLCASEAVTFQKVRLWMPDHGHGTTPTRLETANENCVNVNKLNFVMPGRWQLFIEITDGDTATLDVSVN